ncbi:MAG: FHA domain-containing protein [Polyangiaceae bacterium]|nr:FHA domain-containing protein [Polyangiaceae bacterium]
MALSIIVRSGTPPSRSAPRISLDAPRIVIGRARGSEVRLPDPSVSQRHASIRQRGADYIIMDEGSVNGTFVGSVRLAPQAPRVVRSGDLIRVGRVWLELTFDQAAPDPNVKQHTYEMALSLVSHALALDGSPSTPRVSIAGPPGNADYLELIDFEQAYVVGRSHADLVLDDPDVSRRHLEILRRGEDVLVRDVGSKNGSYFKNERLDPLQWVPWDPAYPVKLGAVSLVLTDPVSLALRELEKVADEQMKDDELIEPPEPSQEEDHAGWTGGVSRTIERYSVEPRETNPNPLAKGPLHPTAGPLNNRRAGMGEVAIGLLALVVILTSVLGLVWLLSGT